MSLLHFSGPVLLFPAQKLSGRVISTEPEEMHLTPAARRAAAGRRRGRLASLRSILEFVP